jgi:hypothetical protein
VTFHANALGIAWDPFVEVIQQSFRNSDVYPLASGLRGAAGVWPDRIRVVLANPHRLPARGRPL